MRLGSRPPPRDNAKSGGVMLAARVLAHANVLSFDMGGTRKSCACAEWANSFASALSIGGGINIAGRLLKGGGYHVSAPAIAIAHVGAAAASWALMSAGGAARPGQRRSAPGPACYGRGGAEATVTDANVVLGFINPEGLAGGSLPLHPMLARERSRTASAAPTRSFESERPRGALPEQVPDRGRQG
jgi:N-methylhydantoinase A